MFQTPVPGYQVVDIMFFIAMFCFALILIAAVLIILDRLSKGKNRRDK